MKLSDVSKRLNNPFPAHLIQWEAGMWDKDRVNVLMTPDYPASTVMDRLDAICPDAWSFAVEPVPGAPLPTMRGALTVLGVTRSDVGTADNHKAASDDALKRCGVHFGIGRYLLDLPKFWTAWDAGQDKPVQMPALPDWARPDHERTPGGAHLIQAMEQLRLELPEDMDLQREVYRHLKGALSSLHPVPALDGAK